MVWYSHLFQNFPQFIVIHTVKGIGIVNILEITFNPFPQDLLLLFVFIIVLCLISVLLSVCVFTEVSVTLVVG